MKKNKRVVLIAISALLLAIYLINYLTLQKPFSDVISADTRNDNIDFSTHYAYYIDFSTLVINVNYVNHDKSAADIFRVMLQYAEKLKSSDFTQIELASKGVKKFTFKGDYFKKIGKEYETQNPIYTMRTFPENLYNPNGKKAFSSWTGGFLGVFGEQMKDFAEVHQRWYIEDMDKDL